MKKGKVLTFVGCMILIVAMLTACGTASNATSTASNANSSASSNSDIAATSSTDTGDKKFSFAFLPNTQNNTFQSSMNDTFKKLAEEKGYKYVCLDPDYNLNTQLSQISDAANQKFDAVFIIPVDSAGIRQGLEQLKSKNIPVINVDTPVINSDLDLVKTVIATDAYQAGTLVGKEMVKKYPDGGKIAILDFPSNESCVNRVNGFLEGLGSSKNKFKIVAQQDGKAALDASMPIAADILQANPDLKAFFAINDPSALGAVAALKAANKKDIGVFSIDASPEGKAALVDGTFTSVACQVPIQIAKTAFDKAVDLLNGKTIDKKILLPSHIVNVDEAKKTAGQWQ